MTPLGVPVDPEVYIMMHGESGLGRTGSVSTSSSLLLLVDFLPRETTSQKDSNLTSSRNPDVSVLVMGFSKKIIFLTVEVCFKMERNFGRSSWLVMTVSTSVSLRPCITASSPRFV